MGISKNNDLYYAPSYLYKSTRTLPPQNNLFDLKKNNKEHYNALQTKKKPLWSKQNRRDSPSHCNRFVNNIIVYMLNNV